MFSKINIITLSSKLGQNSSIGLRDLSPKILNSVLKLSLILSFHRFVNSFLDTFTFLPLYITFEISLLFIFFIKKNSKELYFSFYIEGLSILMFILVYIADLF